MHCTNSGKNQLSSFSAVDVVAVVVFAANNIITVDKCCASGLNGDGSDGCINKLVQLQHLRTTVQQVFYLKNNQYISAYPMRFVLLYVQQYYSPKHVPLSCAIVTLVILDSLHVLATKRVEEIRQTSEKTIKPCVERIRLTLQISSAAFKARCTYGRTHT
uniref:Uncharacterized protein n=1 Tax=Glossina austeni TaxID=7395 RepID=A0A1A9VHP5_GLOAU